MSGMTDREAMKIISMNVARHQDRSPLAEALKHIATRLRGEAAPDGQAVAFSLRFPDGEVNAMTTFSTRDRAELYAAQCVNPPEVVPLYERPNSAAPAPVAGGADAMCPNCVTPWKCNGPHEESGAVGEFDGYTLVPTSNLRRIADELGMEGGIYAPKLRREVLAYIEVSPSLFAEAQPPAAGVEASEEMRAEIEVLRRAVRTGISVITESCAPRGNPDIDDASEIAAALHDMRAVLPDPLPELTAALRTGGGA